MSDTQKVAVVFPGQGSQFLGMLAQEYNQHPIVKKIFEKASDVLNYDLWSLTQDGPVEKLNKTEFTQPAILTASIALWEIFNTESNIKPSVLAGHSLGEYTALVAAKSLDFQDAVKLVSARGKFMQEAVPVGCGAMAAVLGIDDNNIIQNVLNNININNTTKVEIANLNTIGQTVIAGDKASVLLAVEQLKTAGAKLVKLLDVSVPSHCFLMQPAADKLKNLLNNIKFNTPEIPVIHNYSVACYINSDDIRNALYQQLTSPVRWVETIEFICAKGIYNIRECGPGNVLTKLCKRINNNIIV